MPKHTILTTIVVVLALVSAADARYCSNPRCRMCNRIFGPMPGYDTWGRYVGRAITPRSVIQQRPRGGIDYYVDKYAPAPVPLADDPGTFRLHNADSSRVAPARQADPVIHSTPHWAVGVMLSQLRLTADDILYDLGCGDGRFLIAAVQQYGCRAVGIEMDPAVAAVARRTVARSGWAARRILIVQGDATRYKLDGADAVVMYQCGDLMAKLVPKLRTNRIASYLHPVPGKQCRRIDVLGDQIYVAVLESRSNWR